MANKEESDSEEILFGFDCANFENDGTTTADKELNGIGNGSGSSTYGLVFVNANNYNTNIKKPRKTSDSSDEDIQPQPMDSIVSTTPKSPRVLSEFKNNKFDIVSLGSSPLNILNILNRDNMNMNDKVLKSLEYIQNTLPNLHNLYWHTIWAQIIRSEKQVKCVNYRATENNIKNVMNNGTHNILQFIGHCFNPMEIDNDVDNDNNLYKHLITDEIVGCNNDYVLLECDNNIINGKWYDIQNLKTFFNSDYNDIVIVLSPNYKKMVNIFSKLGYKYIVGVKTFNENVQKHNRDKNANKIKNFLSHLYSAILDGECIDRAFELALTVCSKDIATSLVEADVLKKLVSTESMMSELNKKTIQRHQTIGPNNRFMLHIGDNCDERYVVFHDCKHGDPIDMTKLSWNSSCHHLQYEIPFIGRSKDLIQLYNAISKYQIISCIGGKNYGRRSVIIKLMNYLQQHRYPFSHGIMVIDCENKELNKYSFNDIMEHRLTDQFMNVNGYAFNDILDDIVAQIPNVSICIVILNVDAWKNKFDDPRKWIKQYALKMPKTCKCIYTDDSDNLMKSFKKLPLTGVDSTNSEQMYISSNNSINYNKYIKAMETFFANTFTAMKINKLSKENLSQLFMNTLANSEIEFEIKHIENHKGLQKKFDGKARFVKRAAAFVSQLQTTESKNKLTLDSIYKKLPNEWISNDIEFPMTGMGFYHSHSVSPWINTNFEKYLTPTDIFPQDSININAQLDEEDNKIDDTLNQIKNATNIEELIPLLKSNHLNALKQLLSNDYKQSQSPLDIIINFRESFKSTASFQLTPPPEILAGRHDTPYPNNIPFQTSIAYQPSGIHLQTSLPVQMDELRNRFDNTIPVIDKDDEIIIKTNSNVSNISHSLAVPTIRSDKSLPGIPGQYNKHNNSSKSILPSLNTIQSREENKAVSIGTLGIELEDNKLFAKKKNKKKGKNNKVTNISNSDVLRLPALGVSNSRKKLTKHALNESISYIEAEAIAIEDSPFDVSKIFDGKLQKLWLRKCYNNNRHITMLDQLQDVFNKRFQTITSINRKILKLNLLNTYYLESFEITKCKELNNKLAINISQFETFWNWLESLCYVIVKFKTMYKINDSRNGCYSQEREFGMLIGKMNAKNILLQQENKHINGAFILYIDANEQLNILYRNSRYDTNNELNEYIIKYDKNGKYYTVNNKKDDPIKFIKRTTSLKEFYCLKRKRLIKKKLLFK